MMGAIERRYGAYLGARDAAGLRRALKPARRPDARHIEIGGRTLVNFAGNDSLGLSFHPAPIERACDWASRHGTGSGASRLIGDPDLFAGIEAKVAAMKGKETALIFASGFQANATVLAALFDAKALGAQPLVFADKFNHASMHFGCAAASVRQIRYAHADVVHLSRLLESHRDDGAPKFILTESVFSMDGDVAPLDAIADLAREHGAMLIVDDAHATGLYGEAGAGLGQDADTVIGTFSKALGGFGAYVACSEVIRDYLVNACAGLIYSTALPPPVLGAIDAALDLLPKLEAERAHVTALSGMLRHEAQAAGYTTGASATHIVPLIVGGAHAAKALSLHLAEQGYFAPAIRPPTVAQNAARVRVSLSAAHEEADVAGLVSALRDARPKAA